MLSNVSERYVEKFLVCGEHNNLIGTDALWAESGGMRSMRDKVPEVADVQRTAPGGGHKVFAAKCKNFLFFYLFH